MNTLIVGADKTPILENLGQSFLFIDDGPLIDQIDVRAKYFDVAKHHVNPLHRMDYLKAREFVAVLDAVFPEGENTLRRGDANFNLLTALLDEDRKPYLDKLLQPDKKDPAKQYAYQKIETLLLSPVLRTVLCKPTNFSLKGIVIARLDRALLGDFDCFVLANLLISQFQGQVIVPDFGFYGREHHIALIRQNRLVAGVTTLADVSEKLRQALLTIPNKIGSQATYEDADVLAKYAGIVPRTVGHSDYTKDAME